MGEHPSRESLERLLAESLSDEERAHIEGHVEQCTQCQGILHELTLGAAGPESRLTKGASADPWARGRDEQTEAFFTRLKRMRPLDALTGNGKAIVEVEGYEIIGEVGRGAAGVVYRARHLKLNRLVALKVISAGPHLSAEVRLRFRLEALAIARLQHANIVRIYDVGEQGEFPFLSLELIEGGTLASRMAGKPKAPQDAARIVQTLANAVQYAHQQGVIHRDLKPGNVLLSLVVGEPGQCELKITDFGIAKLVGGAASAEAHMTQTGEILGTPMYMAPEQARGNVGEIGAAVDVYSLGAMLYELLTGRPPFQGATPLDTLMQAARQDPVAISLLVPRVPRDLETICLKCLEKELAKRYPTAAELAADLERFLNNEPILARPLSWVGQTERWVRRHRGLAAALSAVAFLLVLLTVGSLSAMAYFRSQEQRDRALAQEKGRLADGERTALDEADKARKEADKARERESMLRQQAERQGRELRQNLYFDQMTLAAQAAVSPSGIAQVAERLAPRAIGRPDLRNWEWYYLDGLCHRDLLTLCGHIGGVLSVAWSPDGQRLASGASDNTVMIWNAASGEQILRLAGHSREVNCVSWSPDGHRLASASRDGIAKIWNADTGEEILSFHGHTASLLAVAWSPDGTRLASGGDDRSVQIWDAKTGVVKFNLRGHSHSVAHLAWSPDSKQLASASEDMDVRIWDTTTGVNRLVLKGHINFVNSVEWSPDGTRLASASNDQTVRIWDAASGNELRRIKGHNNGISTVAWSPDGSRVASAGDDRTLRVWAADGAELFMMRGHTQGINCLAWSPDGARLASASYDGAIKIWSASTGPEVPLLVGHSDNINSASWSPDSRRLATAAADGLAKVWDVNGRREMLTFAGHTDRVQTVAWSPDGTRVASAGYDHAIRVWDAASGKQLNALRVEGDGIVGLAWRPDCKRLASAGLDHIVRIWDPSGVAELSHYEGHDGPVYGVAWSPDGRRIASASADHTVRIWDEVSSQPVFVLYQQPMGVNCVAWSADGKRLAAGGDDQTIKIWDPVTGRPLLTLRGHTAPVHGVAWSADGTRLVSASDDHTLRLWDTASGRQTLTLDGGPAMIDALAWSPDGCMIASGAQDHLVRLFDATSALLSAGSPRFLPILERRLVAEPANPLLWRIRAESDATQGDWNGAATAARRWLDLNQENQWFSLGYWVVGPYPQDMGVSLPPERECEPGQSLNKDEGSQTPEASNWQLVPQNRAGFVNFGELFGHAEHISAYAQLRVYSPKEQPVAILLGSDDQIRLWLNGENIHESLTERSAVPDDDAVAATLSKGWNVLLARVANVTGQHAMYLRLSTDAADMKRVNP